MKISNDGKYKLYPDCANEVSTGKTVAAWNAHNHSPNPSYPNTAQFLQQYGAEVPAPDPAIAVPKPDTQVLQEQYTALLTEYTQLKANLKQFYTDIASSNAITLLNVINANKAAAQKGLDSAPYK